MMKKPSSIVVCDAAPRSAADLGVKKAVTPNRTQSVVAANTARSQMRVTREEAIAADSSTFLFLAYFKDFVVSQ